MSSNWGNYLQLSIFGESHGTGIGVVLNGVPAGLAVDWEELAAFMRRRAPGNMEGSTPRKEADVPEILSGIYNDITTGTPIAALIRNTDAHSKDYSEYARMARPGHADYTGFIRYNGFQDVRGGGHFSARLTAPLCFAGGIVKQLLAKQQIFIGAHLFSAAGITDTPFDPVKLDVETILSIQTLRFPVLEESAGQQMQAAIQEARKAQDSVGGIVECAVLGLPVGIGSPMFDGLENRIASIVFGIPAVKGIEFGAGFGAARMRGSDSNDPFTVQDDTVVTTSNHAGGILGGISTGMPLILRAALKPTPSIAKPQQTVDFFTKTQTAIQIKGRHDACVAVRAVPVIEAAVAIAIADALLEAKGYEGVLQKQPLPSPAQ